MKTVLPAVFAALALSGVTAAQTVTTKSGKVKGATEDGISTFLGIPYAAGCQTIGICTFRENEREHPRAVVGMTDLSARKNVRRQFGKDVLSVSVTPTMLQRMEENVEGSFLQRETWKSLLE